MPLDAIRINAMSVTPVTDEDLAKLLPDGYSVLNGNDDLSKDEKQKIENLPWPKRIMSETGVISYSDFTQEEGDAKVKECQSAKDKIEEPWRKRQAEFNRILLKKACGAVRGIIAVIGEYYPKAGVIIQYNMNFDPVVDPLIAEVAPFTVRLVHYGKTTKEKIKIDEDAMIEDSE
jgi:hypothetical protein